MSDFKIDINKTVTSRLNIQPEKLPTGGYKYDGLCPIRFVGCSITTQTAEKGQFAGIETKVLNFDFVNYKTSASDPDRYLTHQEKVIGTQKKDGESYVDMDRAIVDKLIENMWGRVKHILDSCMGLANYRDIIKDVNLTKVIAFPDTNDGAKIAEAFDKFYQFVCDFVNGDGKKILPIYLNTDGKGVALWAKLLSAYPDFKRYAFPTFVGQGFLEKINFTGDKPVPAKIIQIKPSETLELASGKRAGGAAIPGIAPGDKAIPADIADLLGMNK